MLRHLNEHTDLNDPESVERYVFNKDWKNKSRNNYFNAYQHYCESSNIKWNRPSIKEETYPIKIPTEEKINLIISQATKIRNHLPPQQAWPETRRNKQDNTARH
jgi:hypothetical protein